jgi:plasmid stability protein
MPSLILRDLPEEVHKRLRDRAQRHHRSMTKEAVSILEHELVAAGPVRLPPVVHAAQPIPTDVIDRAIEEGRE